MSDKDPIYYGIIQALENDGPFAVVPLFDGWNPWDISFFMGWGFGTSQSEVYGRMKSWIDLLNKTWAWQSHMPMRAVDPSDLPEYVRYSDEIKRQHNDPLAGAIRVFKNNDHVRIDRALDED